LAKSERHQASTAKSLRPTGPARASHPDHTRHLKRISRVRGQINGIERMIIEKRYCPDIMTQLKAARAALSAIESEIFKSHLRGCVKQAFNAVDELDCERKIDEIVKIAF